MPAESYFPRATASAFADWVFRRENPGWVPPNQGDVAEKAKQLELGIADHQFVELFLNHCWTNRKLAKTGTTGWRLLFADRGDGNQRYFSATNLTVAGHALRCIPDVVLQHQQSNSLIIIERKTTRTHRIPPAGWPNVEAQLWCYSHIDEFASADRVLLVSQLWQRSNGGLCLNSVHPNWLRGDAPHEQRCIDWFVEYGGVVGRGA